MSLSRYKLKKWIKMLSGNSVFHVNQDEGKVYSKDNVAGYYNNLTEKITRFGLLDDSVPKYFVDTGEEIYFSISIFQYGLAAYDLFLINHDKSMLNKVKACADWAVENQQEDGSWITFAYQSKDHPYSSMAQGEGISLLIRAYIAFGHDIYQDSAHKAKNFMLTPLNEGGTTVYNNGRVYLYEFTTSPLVLNGWIFSAWGLYDYYKMFGDPDVEALWLKTVNTIAENLSSFDLGYWSKYNEASIIASPFYHKLHIAQLNVMYDLTANPIFLFYSEKFQKYQRKWLNRQFAFMYKAFQKIFD